jgi:hypothetical protein
LERFPREEKKKEERVAVSPAPRSLTAINMYNTAHTFGIVEKPSLVLFGWF